MNTASRLTHGVIYGVFLAAVLALGYQVLHLFVRSVAWAVILAYLTWPVYRQLRRWLRGHPSMSALLMTLLLGALLSLPLWWLITLLAAELPSAYQSLVDYFSHGPRPLPESLVRIPWLGPQLQALFDEFAASDRAALTERLVQWGKPWIDEMVAVLGDVGRNAFKFGFALLTIFFIYRDGDALLNQTRDVLLGFLGERARAYLLAIGDTTRAVLYGLVLTALVQGLLAGLGYWVAGIPAPVLFGALTAMVALMPFGPPFVWVPLSVWLLLSGQTVSGIGLLIWGALVVSQIDNLIRPLMISGVARIPFLLVLFGVLGGIAAYGLIGLFLGPVVVAVLLAVWREWLEEQREFR